MAFLRLIPLAGAALLFLNLARAVSLPEEESDTATHVDCLDEMNALRDQVGLPPFKQATDQIGPRKVLPTTESRGLWSGDVHAFCEGIYREGNPKAVLLEPEEEGYTFAFVQQYGEKADCKAAVDYWKSAGKHFGDSTPVYTTDAVAPYDLAETRSFVALFNPQPDPLIDCAYFRCPLNEWRPKPNIIPFPAQPVEPASCDPHHHNPNELQSPLAKSVYAMTALVCVTYPPPLIKNNAPFTKEQFNMIMSQIKGRDP